jgi:hypothetical protein
MWLLISVQAKLLPRRRREVDCPRNWRRQQHRLQGMDITIYAALEYCNYSLFFCFFFQFIFSQLPDIVNKYLEQEHIHPSWNETVISPIQTLFSHVCSRAMDSVVLMCIVQLLLLMHPAV